MAKFYAELTDDLLAFIAEQKIFFTATAPTTGRINLSPKGLETFRCLDSRTVAYLDLTGSGNETAAHLKDNGRMTMMFCSFSYNPLILRLYGRGYVVVPRDRAWNSLLDYFEPLPGIRQIIVLNLDSVQTSCGFGVPLYEYQGDRTALTDFAQNRGKEGIQAYQQQKNRVSIDGLPTGLFADEG